MLMTQKVSALFEFIQSKHELRHQFSRAMKSLESHLKIDFIEVLILWVELVVNLDGMGIYRLKNLTIKMAKKAILAGHVIAQEV